jgi:hypothetical protein
MSTVVPVTDKEQRQLWTAEQFLDWLQPDVFTPI